MVCKPQPQISGIRLGCCLPELVDEDKQAEVCDWFINARNASTTLANKELGGGKYSEEELRPIRIKSLSEAAN